MKVLEPSFVIGLERQRCTPGKAVAEHNAAVSARSGFNAVLNELEAEGRYEAARAIRNHVKHLVWWAQHEQMAARAARLRLARSN